MVYLATVKRRACPVCGEQVAVSPSGDLRRHANPANPPLPFARYMCPGPTPEQRAEALRKDARYHDMARG